MNGKADGVVYDDMDDTSPDWYDDGPPVETGLVRLYLDFGRDFGRVQPVLRRWYDEVVDLVVPELGPGVKPPKHGRVVDEAGPGGGPPARRVSDWSDALTADFSQISWGWSSSRRRSSLDLYVFRFAAPDHVMLEASVSFEDQPGRLAEVAPRLAEFLRRVADSTDPAYGEVALDGGAVTAETLLDMGLYRINSDSAAESRRFLRGYDWVTVCPGNWSDISAAPMPSPRPGRSRRSSRCRRAVCCCGPGTRGNRIRPRRCMRSSGRWRRSCRPVSRVGCPVTT